MNKILTSSEFKDLLSNLPSSKKAIVKIFEQTIESIDKSENDKELLSFNFRTSNIDELKKHSHFHPITISKEIQHCLNYLLDLIQVITIKLIVFVNYFLAQFFIFWVGQTKLKHISITSIVFQFIQMMFRMI
jgi:hypothetical protein